MEEIETESHRREMIILCGSVFLYKNMRILLDSVKGCDRMGHRDDVRMDDKKGRKKVFKKLEIEKKG